MGTSVAPRMFKNFINGEWVDSRSGKAYENRNPANTDELVGMFVSGTEEDANQAVDAAKEAYKKWRLVPAPKRAEIMFRAAERLLQGKEDFSKDMTREIGKVLPRNRGDVQGTLDMTYYIAGEGYAAVGVQPGASADGGGRSAGSGESGKRQRIDSRCRHNGKSRCAGGQLYRLDGSRSRHFAGVCAGVQALQPRNGREKHHHR